MTETRTRNITAAFRAATIEDRAAGREWYQRASYLALQLATEHGTTMRQAAGVIAALSPRLAWRKNVEYARLAFRLYYVGTMRHPLQSRAVWESQMPVLKANARKAWRILEGEDPDAVLGGPKVRAFYFTIVSPDDPRAVVIDRHAFDVAAGQVLDDARRGIVLGRKGAYDAVSTLYRRAARIISRETGEHWTPAEIQATTWTYWRRERAAAYHGEA